MQATLQVTPTSVIRLCGPLVVKLDGRDVERALPSRQGRLVFAYLVLHRERQVSRDELIEALWPATGPDAPDALLTSLLSRLRRALPAGTLAGRSLLSLQLSDGAWVDVETASAAPGVARAALANGDARAALALARAALDVLRQPLLPEFDRGWVDERRRELESLTPALLETVARAGLARAARSWRGRARRRAS